MLKVEGLSTGYGDIPIVHDVSLEVPEGTLAALIGPNGAGKTTLVKALAGLLPISSGDVLMAGRSLKGVEAHARTRLGLTLVPDGGAVFPRMTVAENLKLGAQVARARGRHPVDDLVNDLLPVLADRRNQIAGGLSGGERQMVALGRALLMEPDVLILDEPSIGLAPKVVEDIFAMLRRLQDAFGRALTVLMVEQRVVEALEVADTVFVMERGQIALAGPTAEVADDPRIQSSYLG